MQENERFQLLTKVCDQLSKMNHTISPEERQLIMSVEADESDNEWNGMES